jgi:methanogenic corrinoid protein MtbC1
MQPSQAVRALRVAEERDGLAGLSPGTESTGGIAGPLSISALQDGLTAALLDHDLSRADRVLQDAVAAVDPETLMLELIAPVMAEFGAKWETGEIDVATEHLATNFLRQKLLLWMLTSPEPQPMPLVVMACAPGEMHEGSLLLLAALLRRRRVPVAYLGQATPLTDLAALVDELEPSLVVLSATREETATKLVDWPEYLTGAHTTGTPVVAYGGRIFSADAEWQQRVPGIYLGDSLEQGLEAIERLLPLRD